MTNLDNQGGSACGAGRRARRLHGNRWSGVGKDDRRPVADCVAAIRLGLVEGLVGRREDAFVVEAEAAGGGGGAEADRQLAAVPDRVGRDGPPEVLCYPRALARGGAR